MRPPGGGEAMRPDPMRDGGMPDDETLEGEPVAGDESTIRKALVVSAILLVVVAAVVAVLVVVAGRRKVEAPVEERPLVLPREQTVAARPPAVEFTDITESAGITFVHENGARGRKLLPETMGPGCAFFDYDGDEDPDLLLVNGMPWPDDADGGGGSPASAKLFRNDGGGRFSDVTGEAGLDAPLYGMGAAVGDYDGDGRIDLFLTAVGENRLLRNVGGRFSDVTAAAGVAGDAREWSASAGFFDADNDGDLDLFVCNYVRWSPEIDFAVDYRLVGIGRAYGPPTNFEGTQPYFYRNNGDGTFTEAAEEVGMHVFNPATGGPVAKSLALLPLDADGDGWIDIIVANDTVRNFLFRNNGDGTFTEYGETSGIAYDGAGAATGAMGIDGAYFRNDRILAIGIGNFATEMSSFYVSEDGRFYSDEAVTCGIGPVSRQMLSFGLFFFDYDLDGRVDLFQANGHLEEQIHEVQPSQNYRQPCQLFWNCGSDAAGRFVPVDAATTGDLARPVVGRAASFADIDGDGDLDLAVTQVRDRPLLLRNDQDLGNHWIRIRLVGRAPNRDAIGAWVEVDAGGVTQRAQVMPTRSYLAQVEPVLTFGLGAADRADRVRIFWPGTQAPELLEALPADRLHRIERDR